MDAFSRMLTRAGTSCWFSQSSRTPSRLTARALLQPHHSFLLLPICHQARKEGNADVAARLERALSAAWSVKQATLRPELQLLNALVRADSDAARRQVRRSCA